MYGLSLDGNATICGRWGLCVYTSKEIFDIIGGDDFWKDFETCSL